MYKPITDEKLEKFWSHEFVEAVLLSSFAACIATAILVEKKQLSIYQWRSIIMGVITFFVMAWTRMDRDLFVGGLVVTSVIISWSLWDTVRAPPKRPAGTKD
ncbi:unnamed protein product [Arabidopsis lyrata]|uniref:Predicted protein n=1 Tax=Arabidopsis lyrata subsp. lyrata TaxID=81972 RepID=D7LZL1_ARALL|nr:predicted protein [Arabidopsis lyrata subsp. lyrata]CAH8272976.1 unnamed protein product [Arabidopsis lyrata]